MDQVRQNFKTIAFFIFFCFEVDSICSVHFCGHCLPTIVSSFSGTVVPVLILMLIPALFSFFYFADILCACTCVHVLYLCLHYIWHLAFGISHLTFTFTSSESSNGICFTAGFVTSRRTCFTAK